jgi:hypothetical protein
MTKVADADDTATELIRVEAWFLGASIPSGTQNVVITLNTAEYLSPMLISMSAAADTEVVDFGILENNQANPQIALDSGATDAIRYCMIGSGLASVTNLTPVSGMTAVGSRDHGSIVERIDRRTSIESGSQTIGYTASSDDVAMVAVAISEAGGTPVTVALTPATMAIAAQALIPTPAAHSHALTPASMSLVPQALTVVRAPSAIALTPASLSLGAQALTVVPGAHSHALTPAQFALVAQVLVPVVLTPVEIALTPASLAMTASGLTVIGGPVTVPLTPASLSMQAQQLAPTIAVVIALTPATLTVEAQALVAVVTLIGVEIQLVPATLVISAVQPGTIHPEVNRFRPNLKYRTARSVNKHGHRFPPSHR